MQKEIDDAEDKLLALLEKRIRLLEADTVKRRAGKLAAGREANIGYMGGETMRGDEGRGGGGGLLGTPPPSPPLLTGAGQLAFSASVRGWSLSRALALS